MVFSVSLASGAAAAASAPSPDPAALARHIVQDNTQGNRRDLAEIKRAIDAVTARDPGLGEALRRAV